MRAALFAFSRGGCATARRVLEALPEEVWMCYTMPRFGEPGFLPLDRAIYGVCFSSMDALIFVGACGIAVREMTPPSSRTIALAVPAGGRAGPATRRFARFAEEWVKKNDPQKL